MQAARGDEAVIKQATEHFGLTSDAREAGYILPNGKMLDLTGRHYATGYEKVEGRYQPQAGQRDYLTGTRNVDHRELGDIGPGGTEGMHDFMAKSGAVRFDHNGAIQAVGVPSDAQLRQIVRGLKDAGAEGAQVESIKPDGTVRGSIDLQRLTVANLKKFFENPEGSMGETKFQRTEAPAEPFYYTSERVLARDLPGMKRATGDQWLSTLRNKGVKQEEIDDLGLAGLPKDQAVTREQLQTLIDANRAEFKEVSFGNEGLVSEAQSWFEKNGPVLQGISFSEFHQKLIRAANNDVRAQEWAQAVGVPRELYASGIRPPLFEQYQLPGAENYREMVLAMPLRDPKTVQTVSGRTVIANPDYTSTHWPGVANPGPHVRMSDRTGSDGAKLLHLEEIQYDFANEKKAGTTKASLPFAKSWSELMLKKMIRMASEQGYDRIIWTPGEEQAKRFSLDTHLSELRYWTTDQGKTWNYFAEPKGGDSGDAMVERAIPDANLDKHLGKEIADRIRKYQGRELHDMPADETMGVDIRSDEIKNAKMFSMKGADLKVLDQGKRTFYDQIVPSFLKKYGGKYGAKVGTEKIKTGEALSLKGLPATANALSAFLRNNHDAYMDRPMGARAEVAEYLKRLRDGEDPETAGNRLTLTTVKFLGGDLGESKPSTSTVHSFEITPELRAKVLGEGQPMYQRTKFQANDRNLYAVHNLTAENLAHAERMGGIAAPSLAVVRDAHGFNNFGEISLIASKEMVDPRAGAKVFGADAYSPRYPTVKYRLNRKAFDAAWKYLEPASKDLGYTLSRDLGDSDVSQKGIAAFEDNTPVMLTYAR